MNKGLILRALGAVVIFGASIQPMALANATSGDSVVFSQGGGTVYKLAEAGVQFVVPAGWQVVRDKDGDFNISKTQGDNYYHVNVSLMPKETSELTPEEQFKAAREGVLSGAEKDFKGMQTADPEKITINGITTRRQVLAGKFNGVDTMGVLYLLSAERPVLVYMQASLKKSMLDKESDMLMNSFSAIE